MLMSVGWVRPHDVSLARLSPCASVITPGPLQFGPPELLATIVPVRIAVVPLGASV